MSTAFHDRQACIGRNQRDDDDNSHFVYLIGQLLCLFFLLRLFLPNHNSTPSLGSANVEFHVGKAEDVLTTITRTISPTTPVVGVVDPPRAGLRMYPSHHTCSCYCRRCCDSFSAM